MPSTGWYQGRGPRLSQACCISGSDEPAPNCMKGIARRLGRKLQFERLLVANLRRGIDRDRQQVGQRRLGQLLRTEAGTAEDHQSAAHVADELLDQLAEAIAQGRRGRAGRHVAQEDQVVLEELLPRRSHARQEQFILLPHLRIRGVEKRAEALHAHQGIAMEDLFDESPFPGRLVLDEHQPQVIVQDADLAVGQVLLPIDFAGQAVHFGHEVHASRLLGLVDELHRLRRARRVAATPFRRSACGCRCRRPAVRHTGGRAWFGRRVRWAARRR